MQLYSIPRYQTVSTGGGLQRRAPGRCSVEKCHRPAQWHLYENIYADNYAEVCNLHAETARKEVKEWQ